MSNAHEDDRTYYEFRFEVGDRVWVDGETEPAVVIERWPPVPGCGDPECCVGYDEQYRLRLADGLSFTFDVDELERA